MSELYFETLTMPAGGNGGEDIVDVVEIYDDYPFKEAVSQ